MDDETNTRIHELARSLKSLHLAATMEEALARAKEIMLSSREGQKPLAAMMNVLNQEPKEDTMKPTLSQAKKIEQEVRKDKQEHAAEKELIHEATTELDELDCAVEDAEELVKQAKRVQKKK